MKHIYLLVFQKRAVAYGIGTYIRQLIKCLQNEEGIALNVVYFLSEEKEFHIIEKAQYRIFCIPAITVFEQMTSEYFRNSWYTLKSYIRLNPGDQLIFHLNFVQDGDYIKYVRNDYPNCRILFTLHYQRWAFLLGGNLSAYKKILQKEDMTRENKSVLELYNYEKKILEQVDQIVCLSRYTEEVLIELYHIPREKIRLIYNGFNDEVDRLDCEEKKELKRQLQLPNHEKIILFVGRIDAMKGLETLISAFKQVVDIYPDCRLVIVGEGDFSTYMKEINPYWSKVVFTGRLDQKEVYSFYQIADTGVLPSLHEQCSYVGIEMMAFGLPLIGTSAGGLREMICSYGNGILVEIEETDNKTIVSSERLKCAILDSFGDEKRSAGKLPDIYRIDKMRQAYLSLYGIE